ncbi:MAG TPA: four helix bundle protein [Chitinophagaceae bacterium]|nr:four helix bundle protein [Chitinophagaceae bacterium]
MKSFRDLEIYKESKRLAMEVHRVSMTLSKFEMFKEGGQIRRSSKSVTAMIVEGYGRRRYKADFIKHLVLSQAECDETIVHLYFLFETKSLSDKEWYTIHREEYDILSRKINKFIQWVEDSGMTFRIKTPETSNR